MTKQYYTKFIELSEELSAEIDPALATGDRLEVEFNIEYWAYGAQSEVETEIENVDVVAFYANGTEQVIHVSDLLKEQLIALIDVEDSDLILELEDAFYCGMDY